MAVPAGYTSDIGEIISILCYNTAVFNTRDIVMIANQQSQPLEQNVLLFIRRQGLVRAGQKVLVAVSGGPDSVCLLSVLHRLRDDLQIHLHVAHLDHGLRGAESAADARYVAALANSLDLPCTIEKRDVTDYQTKHRLSPEEAAREVRYAFLAAAAAQVSADLVAVGHTRDDQIETVLLHIIRGTGTRGLRGLLPRSEMRFPTRRLSVVRPLLEIDRASTEKYCLLHNLVPRRDSTNVSLIPLRNRIRLELLPILKNYNPAVAESLLRIARLAGTELDFLAREAQKAWQSAVSRQGKVLVLDKIQFAACHPALQRELFRRAFLELLGMLKDIEDRHIEELLAALAKPAGSVFSLPGGLFFIVGYDRCWLCFDPAAAVPFPPIGDACDIKVPGITRIPGWQVVASVESVAKFLADHESLDPWSSDGFTAFFDCDRVGVDISLRARRRGDFFQPLGLDRLKKVGRFMMDARIPRTWRDRIPVLANPEQIIWLAGWRIDDRVKVTPQTRRVLSLRLTRSGETETA
jgi:tRNA(Ile)-lysidine synthase